MVGFVVPGTWFVGEWIFRGRGVEVSLRREGTTERRVYSGIDFQVEGPDKVDFVLSLVN